MEKLQASMDGESSLLDNTLIVYGSPMADSNLHNHRRCPLSLVGGAGGTIEGGVHHKAEDGTPMANVMLSVMHQLGLEDLESFGDSNGVFSLAAPPTETA
jgi:hypothetical protein